MMGYSERLELQEKRGFPKGRTGENDQKRSPRKIINSPTSKD